MNTKPRTLLSRYEAERKRCEQAKEALEGSLTNEPIRFRTLVEKICGDEIFFDDLQVAAWALVKSGFATLTKDWRIQLAPQE